MASSIATAEPLYVHGIGHYHPETCIDNAFLESLDIDTTDDWILQRVGIRTRHTALPHDYIRQTRNRDPREAESAASCDGIEMAARAAAVALTRAGLSASDIAMVVAGSCAPSYSAPAVASIVAARIGIVAPAFDMNAACASFALHGHVLASMRLPGFVLTVYPENLTKVVDYRNRDAAVLMGDGAAACIWSKTEPGRVVATGTTFASNPTAWPKVCIPTASYLRQDGKAVQAFAARTTTAMVQQLRRGDEFFVGHQANLRMLEHVCTHAGVPASRHLRNVDVRGNCGAAGAPSVLSERWDELIARPSEVVMAMVGAGLSWGEMRLQFTPGAPRARSAEVTP